MSAIKTITGGNTHPDGVSIGNAVTEKVSLYGVTPVVQPAHADQAAMAAITYAAPNASAANSGDATTDTVITSLRTQLIALAADHAATRTLLARMRVDAIALGAIKGAA